MPVKKIKEILLKASEPFIHPRLLVFILEPLFSLLGRRVKRASSPLHQHRHARILVIQIDRIGDCVLTTPFLRQLRRLYPASEITLLCDQSTKNLFTHCPYIDRLLHLDTRGWSLWWKMNYFFLALKESAKLWQHNFDLAIYPHWDADYYCSSFLSYLCGAKWRLAFSERNTSAKSLFNRGYDLFFSHTLVAKTSRHEIDSNLLLLGLLQEGKLPSEKDAAQREPELWLDQQDRAFARAFLKSHNLVARKFITLCLGGSHPRKYWPEERYLEIALWLAEEQNLRLLLVGSKAEKTKSENLTQQVNKHFPGAAVNSCGLTSLRECQALMSLSLLYLGNDTGPMHMASAHKIPVVELSAHALNLSPDMALSPHRFGPMARHRRIIQPAEAKGSCRQAAECQAQESHCIKAIGTQEVKEALASLLTELTTGQFNRQSENTTNAGNKEELLPGAFQLL